MLCESCIRKNNCVSRDGFESTMEIFTSQAMHKQDVTDAIRHLDAMIDATCMMKVEKK